MAAGPARKRKPPSAVPANHARPAGRPATTPANDNWPHWLRVGAIVVAIAGLLAILIFLAFR